MQQWARLSRGPQRSKPRHRRAWTARAAEADLTARGIALVAVTLAFSTAWLEIATTGRLGWFFDTMFVLVSATNALAAARSALYAPMVVPPIALLAVLLVVAIARPSAIDEPGTPPDASVVQMIVVALAHHAIALVVAFGLSLGAVMWRSSVPAR
ncbi:MULTISPECIES: DUF6542 domain-containing protein [Mumia]|uniref:DUF6542 domain-containing protein n=1 Tax=Mumia TaxID=1546255 RepID=UPI001423436E|nr:DUF6542 domain-containing protein [Mumia sp. ZJ430]